VVFVRHALPGERVVAVVTSESSSFLRADAVEVLEPSLDRVEPSCPHAGPGRCGGCDWQHVSLPAQRRLKSALVSEQLRRVARIEREVEVEGLDGHPDGLGWRTRVKFAVDRTGHAGFHRHRSHDIEPVERCPIATPEVNAVGVGSLQWKGARHVEVAVSPDGGEPIVSVETAGNGRPGTFANFPTAAGVVVDGRWQRGPKRVRFEVGGHRFDVSAGVFWQVHPQAAAVLTGCVLEGLEPAAGERAADLYSGAGLFSVALAEAVGPDGSVVGVERSRRACADAGRNTSGLRNVEILRSEVNAAVVSTRLGSPDLVVLDPAREGAGRSVMEALTHLRPPPRRLASVSCDPATFARDLRVMLDAEWTIRSLRAFDLFPMTEHVELVAILEPPVPPPPSRRLTSRS
jgi:tRNA/tmRNA/rRNA uracil-C5-methylase (TrmA/RlmC/RlmD family)